MIKILLLLIFVIFTPFAAFGQSLSDEDRAILAHIVVNPDAWAMHSLAVDPSGKALAAKIARYRADYLAKKDMIGYKTRVERDAIAAKAAEPTTEQILASEKEDLIRERIRKQAIDALIADGKLTESGDIIK